MHISEVIRRSFGNLNDWRCVNVNGTIYRVRPDLIPKGAQPGDWVGIKTSLGPMQGVLL
jgi:hypothetical protein